MELTNYDLRDELSDWPHLDTSSLALEFGLQSNFKSSKQHLGEIRAHVVFSLQKQLGWT